MSWRNSRPRRQACHRRTGGDSVGRRLCTDTACRQAVGRCLRCVAFIRRRGNDSPSLRRRVVGHCERSPSLLGENDLRANTDRPALAPLAACARSSTLSRSSSSAPCSCPARLAIGGARRSCVVEDRAACHRPVSLWQRFGFGSTVAASTVGRQWLRRARRPSARSVRRESPRSLAWPTYM